MHMSTTKTDQKEYEYCLRCGRKLKNPEARIRGFGIICEKKVHKKGSKPLFNMK